MTDLLFEGATVVDGTGSPSRVADVAIEGGRITAVGEHLTRGDALGGPARRVDAAGLVLAPGFVDIHTHYDAQLSWDPTASPSALHGVTTVIGGNCGFTLAPCGPEHAGYLMRMMARVEGMPLAALSEGLAWDWKSFGDWIDRFEGQIAVNAGFLVGHSALRRSAMGDEAVGSAASEQQVAEMQRLLDESLRAGALGLSSSQAPTHNDGEGEPVPSRSAGRDELMELARSVRGHPGTTLELILAGCLNGFSDDEVDLMTSLSLAADRPVNWNVLGVSASNRERLEHQLDASTQASERGATVVALTLPHQMRIRLSFLTGFVLDGLPGWRETLALPVPERIKALSDPSVRSRLAAGARSPEAGILGALARWEHMEVAETFTAANEGIAGQRVGKLARERGGDPFDVLLDIVVADELRTGLHPPTMTEDPADWELRGEVWRDPRTIVGGSDAGAHLDMMCGAIYSTSLLGEGVREHGAILLEEAVRQLTDVPARLYGLSGRGRIAEGWRADLVLFDPDRIGYLAPRTRDDLPGGAPRLYSEAEGIDRVLVNGTEIVRGGVATGALPGTLLRSGRDTETVTAAGVG